MYCDANGTPDVNGRFELVGGVLKPRSLKDGAKVGFELAFMDGAPGASRTFADAKIEPPKSIDEALQQRFARLAKGLNISVKQMLSELDQAKIQEIAAETAAEFVAAHASKGVVAQFATDAFLTDAEMDHVIALAREKHRLSHAYMASPPPFTGQHIADAITASYQKKLVHRTAAATYQADAERLKAEHDDAYAFQKTQLHNAWRH